MWQNGMIGEVLLLAVLVIADRERERERERASEQSKDRTVSGAVGTE